MVPSKKDKEAVYRILAVDDDAIFLKALKRMLEVKEFKVQVTTDPFDGLQKAKSKNFDCILLDVKMPGMDGVQMMDKIKEEDSGTPIIFISGQSNIPIAVEAIKKGAYDFIEKPVEGDRIFLTIRHAIEKNAWARERNNLLTALDERFRMIGESKVMQEIFNKIKIFSQSDAKVLITGETGTGKELVASALHFNGPRAGKPYIKINCAAIPNELLESELFGHKKGAFTSATEDKPGKIQLANDGTLFMDEIGDMDVHLQAKLLKVLDTGEFSMLGSTKAQMATCRFVAATNQDIEQLIKDHLFRQDLYHRLNVLQIHIPPLRQRKEDIPLLARYFLDNASAQYNKRIVDFSKPAMKMLMDQDWPGNIRQLKNVVEKLVIFSSGPVIDEHQVENISQERFVF